MRMVWSSRTKRTLANVRTFVALVSLASLGAVSDAQAGSKDVVSAPMSERIGAILRQLQHDGGYPGLAAAIEKDGQLIYAAGVGFADLEHDLPMSADTVMPIGSVTKSMTAHAVLQLAEQGKIDLNARLERYLPEFKGPAGAVLISQMLNHTSGLPNYIDQNYPDPQTPLGPRAVAEKIRGQPLEFAPGTRYSYTNSDTYLLGLVIESVTGKSYESYLAETLFRPFGMKDSRVADSSVVVPRRGSGYQLRGTTLINARAYDVSYAFSAGAVVSTVKDMIRFAHGLFGEQLSSASVRANTVKIIPLPDRTPMSYSLGALHIEQWHGRPKIEHDGGVSGFASHFAYYPNDRLTIVVMGNLDAGLSDAFAPVIERRLAREVLNIPEPNRQRASVKGIGLDRFAGEFGPFQHRFTVIDGVLHCQRMGFFHGEPSGFLPPVRLEYLGDGKFVSVVDSELVFEFASGNAQSVMRRSSDGEMTLERVPVEPAQPALRR